MGNLSDAVESLVGQINASTERRRTALGELRSNAQILVRRFQQEHRDRTKELKKEFQELKKELGGIASDVKQAGQIWRGESKKNDMPPHRGRKGSGGDQSPSARD